MDIISLLAQSNNDIYQDLFRSLPISGKRSFIRTCKNNSRQFIHMQLAEQLFQKLIVDSHFLEKTCLSDFYCPLSKFTIELLFDGYAIPDKYFIQENRILHQYPKIYKRLGEKGDIGLIERFLKLNRNSYQGKNSNFVMMDAAKVGNLHVLKWMRTNNYEFNDIICAYAAKGNQLETLRYLNQYVDECSPLVTIYAAKKGHTDIVKYLFNYGYPTSVAPYHAAYYGHLDTVKFIYSVYPGATYNVWQGAIWSGNIEILQFLRRKEIDFKDNVFRCKDVNILSWLFDNYRFPMSVNLATSIATDGNFECLQFLYSKKCPMDDVSVFRGAVYGKNIKMLRWLHDVGVPFDETVTDAAVTNSLMILNLLIKLGCKLSGNACEIAAYEHDLEIIKTLYRNGCALNEKVIENAAEHGNLHIIVWCRSQGCKFGANACCATVLWDHLYVLKYLRENGCPWDEQVCLDAITYGHIDILKFAIENGCPYTELSRLAAIESKNPNIAYLFDN